jgi:hypothetical protein
MDSVDEQFAALRVDNAALRLDSIEIKAKINNVEQIATETRSIAVSSEKEAGQSA